MKMTSSARPSASSAASTRCSRRIADDRLEDDFNPELVQMFGEIKGIGVLAEGSQQLRANGDDLGVHASSLNEKQGTD